MPQNLYNTIGKPLSQNVEKVMIVAPYSSVCPSLYVYSYVWAIDVAPP